MKGLAATLLLTCLDATESVERQLHANLGWLKSLQLKAHLKVCAVCQRYAEQSRWLENLLKEKLKSQPDPLSEEEMEELRKKILDTHLKK
jgi:hypothetical protein